MRHVLTVVPRFFHPSVSGGEGRVAELVKGLTRRYRMSVAAFAEPERAVFQAAAALDFERRHGVRVHLIARDPESPPPPARWPDMARAFHDRRMAQELARIVCEERVDLVQIEFTQMLQYAPPLRALARVVATEHDSGIVSPGGSYVRPPRGSSAVFRARAAAAAWAKSALYLRETLYACDRVVAVSQADAERLSWLVSRSRLRVVPTGVDLRRFPFRPMEGRRPGRVAFLGHYPHYPNEDAALFLCRDVLPALLRREPGANVLLVGSAPSAAVQALRSERVELTGTVAEVAPHLSSALVFIAPMRLGRGIKGKILEAFACGTPVVATSLACEAMPGLRHGEHALLAENAEGLAKAAARLLSDRGLSEALARKARAYVEERFGWERNVALLEDVYREALDGARGEPSPAGGHEAGGPGEGQEGTGPRRARTQRKNSSCAASAQNDGRARS